MPYVDDLIAQGEQSLEIFNTPPKDAIQIVSKEIAESQFPGVKLYDSENIKYFPFKLCHSYPAVNARGRTFMPKVLQNSFASLNDQLVDMNHMLKDNEFPSDRIVGCVKATAFTPPADIKTELASLDSIQPVPVRGLGVLFLRAQGVREIVEQHESGKVTYGISMECGHKWKDAILSYRGEFIPLMDAELAMRDCIQKDQIKPFKGHNFAACLGGIEGKVDFWGCAITASPADENADILNFFSAQSKEAASKSVFYMPMRAYGTKELEIAHLTVDKKLSQEVASINVIGETEPDELDGHVHLILSDLTILPSNGHVHCLRSYSLSRGTNPTLTGITDTHYTYPPRNDAGGYSPDPIVHMHLVNLPLKGKLKGQEVEEINTVNIEVANMSKTLQELSASMKTLLDSKTKADNDAAKSVIDKEIAATLGELVNTINQGNTEKERESHIEQLIKDGKIVRKEVADSLVTQAVTAAVEEEKKKHEAEVKAAQIRQARIEKCITAGIDLDTEFVDIKGDDGKPLTLRHKLENHGIDESGDRNFNMDFALWQELFKEEETPAATTEAVATAATGEAANKNKRKILSTVAGGKGKEVAAKPTNGRMVGKSRFAKLS